MTYVIEEQREIDFSFGGVQGTIQVHTGGTQAHIEWGGMNSLLSSLPESKFLDHVNATIHAAKVQAISDKVLGRTKATE